MKSKLTIDFKGVDAQEGGSQFEPVIRAIVEDSDDVRDGLMKSFFQALGGNSSWLKVDIQENTLYQGASKSFIVISPIKPYELSDTIEDIKGRLSVVKSNRQNDTSFHSRFPIGAEIHFTTQELIDQVPRKQDIPKYYQGFIESVTFTQTEVFYNISVRGKGESTLFEKIPSEYVMNFSKETIEDLNKKDFIIN